MKHWEDLGVTGGDGLHRRVEVLGDDEHGYLVNLIESNGYAVNEQIPPGLIPPAAHHVVTFIPLTKEQIREMLLG